MNYISICPDQYLCLEAKKDATLTQALHEAVEFAKQFKTLQCDLYYNGFTFDIEPESDIKKKIKEYNEWITAVFK